MTDNRNATHFGEPKKLNTIIKHYLLSQTLQTSISIANNKCVAYKQSSNKTDNIYTYIDLFAGAGTFEDNSKGSPIIAYDILSEHNNSSFNKFKKLQMACTEKHDESYQKLESTISTYATNDDIDCYIGQGSWELYKKNIESLLKNSGWGFIFADPFSTELDIVALIEILKSYSNLKDILVFFNFNTLARQDGRRCLQDIDRICRTIGIDEKELLDDDSNFSVKFENKLIEHFKGLKKFVIGVGFPTTVKGDLINSDYFYLIFSTNTPVLVDTFLNAYEEMLDKYTDYSGMQQLAIFGNPDKNYIYDVLKENFTNGCSLFDLYLFITSKFLSWKELTKTQKKVPTIKNVVEILNEFESDNSIKIVAEEKFLYKKTTKYGKAGNLKYTEAGNSAESMKNIKIFLNR